MADRVGNSKSNRPTHQLKVLYAYPVTSGWHTVVPAIQTSARLFMLFGPTNIQKHSLAPTFAKSRGQLWVAPNELSYSQTFWEYSKRPTTPDVHWISQSNGKGRHNQSGVVYAILRLSYDKRQTYATIIAETFSESAFSSVKKQMPEFVMFPFRRSYQMISVFWNCPVSRNVRKSVNIPFQLPSTLSQSWSNTSWLGRKTWG